MNRKATHWVKQIDNILNGDARFFYNQFPNGKEILQGIKKDVKSRGTITDKQIQTIKNIKWGKN
jgi:hypothetical protein